MLSIVGDEITESLVLQIPQVRFRFQPNRFHFSIINMASRTWRPAGFLVILVVAMTTGVSQAQYTCSNDTCELGYKCCVMNHGRIVCAGSCSSACFWNDDCSLPEQRCDRVNNQCTRSCDWDSECPPGYECATYECRPAKPEDDDDGLGGVFVTVVIVVVASFMFLCVCFMIKRRQQNREAPVNYIQAVNSAGTNSTALATRSQPERERLTRDQPTAPDPIEATGPPTYYSLNMPPREPELPPPSYDEAVAMARV